MKIRTARLWWAVLAAFQLTAAHAAETWALQTPRGVTQPVLVEVPGNPKAAVVLFAGGDGGVVFSGNDLATYRLNFLLRARTEFLRNGHIVAIIGTPSDRSAPSYLDDKFRKSKEHADDVLAVVGELRKKFNVPVWLIGTSRGTLSAASAGLQLGKSVDGVVLTSSMADLVDLPIDRFEVPVLMVHHEGDGCRETYYREAKRTAARIKAPRTELITFSGGRSEGNPCQALAYHGFNGIESEVVTAISNWMLKP